MFLKNLKIRLHKSFPIKAVFIPNVTFSKEVKISKISVSKAYLALAPSTIFQLQVERMRTHDYVLSLLKQVPCDAMELSTNPQQNTRAIEVFLNNLSH